MTQQRLSAHQLITTAAYNSRVEDRRPYICVVILPAQNITRGGPTPPLLNGARSEQGDQHSVLNEVLMLEVIESLSRVGSNRRLAPTETDIRWRSLFERLLRGLALAETDIRS
jgi:hypothetical protein